MSRRNDDPALRPFGLTQAQARLLAKLKAGQNVSGAMAGVALERKGLVEAETNASGAWAGWVLTGKGERTLAAIRAAGW
jgi:hypothetical protein